MERVDRRTGPRRAEDHRRKLAFRALLAFAVLAVLFSIATYVNQSNVRSAQQKIESNERQIQVLYGLQHLAAINACERLQVLRDDVNSEFRALFAVDSAASDLLNGPPRTRRTRSLGGLFDAAAQALRFIPLTDCQQAVDNPMGYAEPQPRPFQKKVVITP